MASSDSKEHSSGTVEGNAIDVEALALSSNLPDSVPELLQLVAKHGKELFNHDSEARFKLLEATRSLTYALETPREAIIRHCWSEVCEYCYFALFKMIGDH